MTVTGADIKRKLDSLKTEAEQDVFFDKMVNHWEWQAFWETPMPSVASPTFDFWMKRYEELLNDK